MTMTNFKKQCMKKKMCGLGPKQTFLYVAKSFHIFTFIPSLNLNQIPTSAAVDKILNLIYHFQHIQFKSQGQMQFYKMQNTG